MSKQKLETVQSDIVGNYASAGYDKVYVKNSLFEFGSA